MEHCRLCNTSLPFIFSQLQHRDYFLCPSCHGISVGLAQLPSTSAERARYLLHQNGVGEPGHLAFLHKLLTPLGPYLSTKTKILDFGAGPSPALAQFLTMQNFDVTIYDPIFAPRSQLIEEKYDLIIVCEVAEHFHWPAKEFLQLKNLLQPQGLVAIMTSLFHPRIDFASWYYVRDLTHVFFYQAATFEWIAHHYHFQLILPTPNVIFLRNPH